MARRAFSHRETTGREQWKFSAPSKNSNNVADEQGQEVRENQKEQGFFRKIIALKTFNHCIMTAVFILFQRIYATTLSNH